MAYAPQLTAYASLSGSGPSVEVFFSSLPSGTASVTLYRSAGGRQYTVRGAVRASTAGQFTRRDGEVPFGVAVSYRAEAFNSSGVSLGFTSPASITVDELGTWVHNPLDPAGAVQVMFRESAARDLSRPTEGDVFYPQGRRVGVVVSGQRRGLSGVRLDVIVDDIESADRLQAMLGDYNSDTVPVLCFRIGAEDRVRLPRPLFAAVMDAREQDLTYVLGGSQIVTEMEGDEVAPPAPGLFISLLIRADVNAFYASRADVDAYNLTRLDVARNYGIADGSAPALETIEAPAGSGLYTLGQAQQAPESGMFLTTGFTESPAGSGLYTMGGAL
jgi:hypothetical protein